MSYCKHCENELCPTVEGYEFAELGYCSSICYHENIFKEEQVKSLMRRFISKNMVMSLSSVIQFKSELNDLANTLEIPPFYVYYTVDNLSRSTINVTQSYEEFVGVKNCCDFENKQFVGA